MKTRIIAISQQGSELLLSIEHLFTHPYSRPLLEELQRLDHDRIGAATIAYFFDLNIRQQARYCGKYLQAAYLNYQPCELALKPQELIKAIVNLRNHDFLAFLQFRGLLGSGLAPRTILAKLDPIFLDCLGFLESAQLPQDNDCPKEYAGFQPRQAPPLLVNSIVTAVIERFSAYKQFTQEHSGYQERAARQKEFNEVDILRRRAYQKILTIIATSADQNLIAETDQAALALMITPPSATPASFLYFEYQGFPYTCYMHALNAFLGDLKICFEPIIIAEQVQPRHQAAERAGVLNLYALRAEFCETQPNQIVRSSFLPENLELINWWQAPLIDLVMATQNGSEDCIFNPYRPTNCMEFFFWILERKFGFTLTNIFCGTGEIVGSSWAEAPYINQLGQAIELQFVSTLSTEQNHLRFCAALQQHTRFLIFGKFSRTQFPDEIHCAHLAVLKKDSADRWCYLDTGNFPRVLHVAQPELLLPRLVGLHCIFFQEPTL